MAVAIRSVTVGTNNGSSATVSATTSESPSATQVGNLVVVVYCNDYYTLAAMGTPTATGSPILSAITNGTADAGTNHAHIKSYTYVANTAGAQVISATETGSADEEKAIVAWVLSGADTTTPVDVAANGFSASAQALNNAPSCSPGTSDAFLIGHVNSGGGASAASYGTPGSMTERYEIHVGGLSGVGATEQLAASGATGVRAFDPNSDVEFAAVSIAIRTASASATSLPIRRRSQMGAYLSGL